MQLIKFCGKDKKDSLKKVITFLHDNFDNDMSLTVLLAKCRLQSDKKTIHFYPNMKVDIKKLKKQ